MQACALPWLQRKQQQKKQQRWQRLAPPLPRRPPLRLRGLLLRLRGTTLVMRVRGATLLPLRLRGMLLRRLLLRRLLLSLRGLLLMMLLWCQHASGREPMQSLLLPAVVGA